MPFGIRQPVSLYRLLVVTLVPVASASFLACNGERAHDSKGDVSAITRVVRDFYRAAVRDHDYRAACHLAIPRFRLVATGTIGANLNGAGSSHIPIPQAATRPETCVTSVRRIVELRRGFYSWREFVVSDVRLHRRNRRATVTTTDGSVGVVRLRGTWRMAWALGDPRYRPSH